MPPPVNDVTKVVSFPFRPVGFKPQQGKQVTTDDIKDWARKEDRGIIQCLPHFAVWTAVGTIASALIGFVGIKKDSRLCKWLGGILGIVGIASSGFGVYLARLCQTAKTEKKSEEVHEKFFFETPITNSLKKISKEDETNRDELRRKLIGEHMKERDKLKALFEKLKTGNDDEGLRKEAECCLNIISELEKEINDAITRLKDKDVNKELRLKARDILKKALYEQKDQKAMKALAECAKDKSDDPDIRSEALMALPEESHVNLLFDVLTDPNDDQGIRHMAATLLRNLIERDNTEVINRCNSLVNSNDQEVKDFAESVNERIEEKKRDSNKS